MLRPFFYNAKQPFYSSRYIHQISHMFCHKNNNYQLRNLLLCFVYMYWLIWIQQIQMCVREREREGVCNLTVRLYLITFDMTKSIRIFRRFLWVFYQTFCRNTRLLNFISFSSYIEKHSNFFLFPITNMNYLFFFQFFPVRNSGGAVI